MQLSVIREGTRPVRYSKVYHVGVDGNRTPLIGSDAYSPGRILIDLPKSADLHDPVFDEMGHRIEVASRYRTPEGPVIFLETPV